MFSKNECRRSPAGPQARWFYRGEVTSNWGCSAIVFSHLFRLCFQEVRGGSAIGRSSGEEVPKSQFSMRFAPKAGAASPQQPQHRRLLGAPTARKPSAEWKASFLFGI